mmetsp:Transcript_25344/g.35332  ORF Transcript_25344/g.35332 Transcript_25344/m.35332 type:complete len:350 (-) Transcript_25344:107-1156(-)
MLNPGARLAKRRALLMTLGGFLVTLAANSALKRLANGRKLITREAGAVGRGIRTISEMKNRSIEAMAKRRRNAGDLRFYKTSYRGNLQKMRTDSSFGDVQYTLKLGNDTVKMDELVGSKVKILFEGLINCIECGARTRKSYFQGFCFNCMTKSPRASECIIRPDLCKAHLGDGRNVAWELEHHNKTHVVYLAMSSKMKVGVTRDSEVPTRWIDQGATGAITIARVPYRQLAGVIEKHLTPTYGDKTPWQKMLKGIQNSTLSLEVERQAAHTMIREKLPDLVQYLTLDEDPVWLKYPVIEYPSTVKSILLHKTAELNGTLVGIKGQYLIFDGGRAMNVRSHAGYLVQLFV